MRGNHIKRLEENFQQRAIIFATCFHIHTVYEAIATALTHTHTRARPHIFCIHLNRSRARAPSLIRTPIRPNRMNTDEAGSRYHTVHTQRANGYTFNSSARHLYLCVNCYASGHRSCDLRTI